MRHCKQDPYTECQSGFGSNGQLIESVCSRRCVSAPSKDTIHVTVRREGAMILGEARRRKRDDPTFGRLPKSTMDMSRGIVVSSPVNLDDTKITLEGSGLDAQELRHWLLFWDELAWPTSNLIHVAGGPDETFLEEAGVLSRPRMQMYGTFAGSAAMSEPHLAAFKKLDDESPGKWCLATGERSFNWTQMPLTETNAAVLELHRAIPVPNIDVPLAEVLEFKQRRRDEIRRLRAEIDIYVATVHAATDSDAVLLAKAHEIERACADLLRVGHEWKYPVRLTDLKASIEFKPGDVILKAVELGTIGHFAFDMGAVGALLGGILGVSLSSGLKLSGTLIKNERLNPRSTPFQYVHSFHKELF